MDQKYFLDRFLPAIGVILAGRFFNDATDHYFTGLSYPLTGTGLAAAVVGGAGNAVAFFFFTLLVSLPLFALAWAVVGRMGRQQFQATWGWFALVVHALYSSIVLIDLWDRGFLGDLLGREPVVGALVIGAPFYAAFQAAQILLHGLASLNTPSDAEVERARKKAEKELREAPSKEKATSIALACSIPIWITLTAVILTSITSELDPFVVTFWALAAGGVTFLIGWIIRGIATAVLLRRSRLGNVSDYR